MRLPARAAAPPGVSSSADTERSYIGNERASDRGLAPGGNDRSAAARNEPEPIREEPFNGRG